MGSYVLGVPFSFIRFRHSRPWAPLDVFIAGTILALVVTCITVMVVVMMQRYVRLYRRGTSVPGQVVHEVNAQGSAGLLFRS